MSMFCFLTCPVWRSRPCANPGLLKTSPFATKTSVGDLNPALASQSQSFSPSSADIAVSLLPEAERTTLSFSTRVATAQPAFRVELGFFLALGLGFFRARWAPESVCGAVLGLCRHI